jgi:hypothetical protein
MPASLRLSRSVNGINIGAIYNLATTSPLAAQCGLQAISKPV